MTHMGQLRPLLANRLAGGVCSQSSGDVASNAFNWLMGCILVYGCLFGIGKLVFGEWGWGLLLLTLSAIAGYLIFWDLSRRGWATLSGKESTPASQVANAD